MMKQGLLHVPAPDDLLIYNDLPLYNPAPTQVDLGAVTA